MPDNVTATTVYSGRHVARHITNESDSTGETGVTKIDISTFLDPFGKTCSYTNILRIDYSVWGFNYVTLYWDASTDDEIAVLRGQGSMDWEAFGGKTDPKSSGSTGDVLLTTDGATDGSGYDITIVFRPKAT